MSKLNHPVVWLLLLLHTYEGLVDLKDKNFILQEVSNYFNYCTSDKKKLYLLFSSYLPYI